MNLLHKNRIGIFVKKPESIFSNGCIQQALFLKQLFENINFNVDFVSIETDYISFMEESNIHTKDIITLNEHSDISIYKLFLFVSITILNGNPIATLIEKHRIPCIDLICGNLYILHQEEFIFDKHHILSTTWNNPCKECWILEMYPFMTQYVEFLCDKPTHLLPYVWNTTIIDDYMTKHKLDIYTDYDTVDNTKINILIFEPNMSIHKTCLIPLLIANRFYKMNKERLNKVYVFCGKNIESTNMTLFEHLDICKDRKVELYHRMVMPAVIRIVKNDNNFMNVVLSHNIMNQLNFIHLELMHIGIPIVHNCSPFKDNGYYYDDYNYTNAVNHLSNIRCSFKNDTQYQKKIKTIIDHFSPDNEERQMTYKTQIDRIIDTYSISHVNNNEDVVQTYLDTTDFQNDRLFMNKGIIITVSSINDIYLLNTTLESLHEINNKLPIEIVFSSEIFSLEVLLSKCDYCKIYNNNKCNNKFEIEFIDAHESSDCISHELIGLHFGSFLEFIHIYPGYKLHKSSNELMDYCINNTKMNKDTCMVTLNTNKLNILEGINEPIINTEIMYVNKRNDLIKHVLSSLSNKELMHEHVKPAILFAFMIKKLEEKYKTKYVSTLNQDNYIIGCMTDKFKGYGIMYKTETDSFVISYVDKSKRDALQLQTDSNRKFKELMVNIDSINDIYITTDKYYTFKGKAVANKIQYNI